MQYDVFISHSSQDKEAVARPLCDALTDLGLDVWLDEEQLLIGDSIRRGIDEALRHSRFGVVILSPAYLQSEWALKELDAFFSKESLQHKTILPIYHQVEVEAIQQFSPLLADKIGLDTQEGIDSIANKIHHSIQRQSDMKPTPPKPTRRSWKFPYPSTNMQWLIATVIALAAIAIPVWLSNTPTSSPSVQNSVNVGGNMTGGIINQAITPQPATAVDAELPKGIPETIEAKGFQFSPKSCHWQADKKIVCELTITNTENARELIIGNNQSIMLYDNKGNQTNIDSVSLGNVEATISRYGGRNLVRSFPTGVPVQSRLTFKPIPSSDSELASQISIKFQAPRLEVNLLDIPIQ